MHGVHLKIPLLYRLQKIPTNMKHYISITHILENSLEEELSLYKYNDYLFGSGVYTAFFTKEIVHFEADPQLTQLINCLLIIDYIKGQTTKNLIRCEVKYV